MYRLLVSNLKLSFIICFRCDAREFHLSKSHKKVLKKINGFLRSEQKSGNSDKAAINSNANEDSENSPDDCDVKMDAEQPNETDESSALSESKMITSVQPKISINIDNVLEMIEKSETSSKKTELTNAIETDAQAKNYDTGSSCCNKKSNESNKRGFVAGIDPTKPLQPKAKLLRQQRKSEKLLKLANSSTDTSTTPAELAIAKKVPKNTEKNLKALLDEMPTDGQYELKVCVTFSSNPKQIFNLFSWCN